MLEEINKQILDKCSDNLKEDMKEALDKYPFPDVFQGNLASSPFKKDKVAEQYGWSEELQYELWGIIFDKHDVESRN